MVKLFGLFAFSILLLFVGSYLNTNPEWLERYKKPITTSTIFSPPTSPSQAPSTWLSYSSENQEYSLKHPPDWELKPDVPGCGPVWFPPSTQKVWLTVCGPFTDTALTAESMASAAVTSDISLVSKQTVNVDTYDSIRQELSIGQGTATQVYIPSTKGIIAVYFTNLAPKLPNNHEDLFNQILSTLKINR